MANVTKKYVRKEQQFSGPDGNAWKKNFTFATNASGVFVDSDQATAVIVGDVVRIGLLQAGLEMHDALMIVSNAFTAASTAKVGFAYVDGVDSAEVPQSDTYFAAALAINALGRTRASNTASRPVVLPKDAYLILTIAGANLAEVGVLDAIVEGILRGNS